MSTPRRLWPPLLLVSLACLFLWRVVFAGEALLPADLLRYVAPWAAAHGAQDRPAWNPLLYDAIGQMYPWRHFAAQALHAGTVPLWNPYQFCGTPFVANSQSAVLYPGNVLHWFLPTAHAMGWTALLHLVLAGLFTWRFMRGLGASSAAGVVAGLAYAFSTWQVAWLSLPTFLDTSCWLPLVLLLVQAAARGAGWRPVLAAGFAIGMALLAGHLQVAFYVVLAAAFLALALTASRFRQRRWGPAARPLLVLAAGCAIGLFVAAPQVLPALELSRRSHRRATPTEAGYTAYTAYAVSPAALVTAVLPDFYGNPSAPDSPYFGTSRGGMLFNYAEGALYVGVLPLLLAACALRFGLRDDRRAQWLGALALLALLMALGTAVDRVFYFGVPGFGQSGSPGRVLVLWAFATACLAGLGLDRLLSRTDGTARDCGVVVGVVVALAAAAYAIARPAVDAAGVPPELWHPQIGRQAGLLALGALLLMMLPTRRVTGAAATALPVLLIAVDLFANGLNYNPTSPAADVYPATAATRFLQREAGHDRIMPVNQRWSFAGPRAVLPPNGAMVFGLRDVQGYDSLFSGEYKGFMNRLAGTGRDASPPEVGNMVFARDPASPLAAAAGVRWLASLEPLPLPGPSPTVLDGMYLYRLPGAGRAALDPPRAGTVEWLQDDPTRVAMRVSTPAPASLTLADERYPGWRATVDGRPVSIERADVFRRIAVPAGTHAVAFQYEPASFRTGLYLLLLALLTGAAALAARDTEVTRGTVRR